MDGTDFLEIVSGRRRGPVAAACRLAFRAVEFPYGAVIRWRNHRYDRGQGVQRVAAPVISVGNLTVGGTGKTPLIEWLARWYRRHGARVVIVSRGYGAESGARNDEALDLEQKLPDVPHLQSPDRVAAAETAIEEFESELILLDDAFQHRRIHRDLDIVLIDAIQPFGFEHLLPRGLLREPVASLKRAHVIVLSRANLVSESERQRIVHCLHDSAPGVPLVEIQHEPKQWLSAAGDTHHLEALADQRVAAFCGIGNPEAFRQTLGACGVRLVGFRPYPDHHAFRSQDLQRLAEWARDVDATTLVCTTKDMVKLRAEKVGALPVMALEIEIRFRSGQQTLEGLLAEVHDASATR